jgi:hypothetical protein
MSKKGGYYEPYYCTWDMCTKAQYKDQIPARYINTNVLAKRELAYMLLLRHKEEYFVKYQNEVLKIQWMVLSMDTSVGRYSEIHVKYEHVS